MGDKLPQDIVLSVGKRYPEWQTGQDGYILEWSETGFVLCAMLNGISQEEKEQFSTQKKLIVRYTVVEDVCYFTFLFGDMPWADCPFSPTLYKTIGENPTFPDIEENKGLSLTVLLIDTGTGELSNIRLIGLGHDFSVKWKNWAINAVEKPLDFAEYNKRIDKAYTEYSNVDFALKGLEEQNEYIVEGN